MLPGVMRRSIAALALIGILTLAPWLYPIVSSWFHDDGVFFRLKANYLHGSEQIDFDIVVGCSVRVTAYKDGEESYDAVRDPLFFVKATLDGGALLQIVPNACLGQTTKNRDVPKDFLPGAIWFDSKEDFSFGIGYVTEDAFESPRSKLKFLGATITKASRREWKAFQPIAAQNLLSPRMYTWMDIPRPTWREIHDNLWNKSKIAEWRPLLNCRGIWRMELVDAKQREALREYWPGSRPHYWRPSKVGEVISRLADLHPDREVTGPKGPLGKYRFVYGQSGFPTRAGGGEFLSGVPSSQIPAELYPVRADTGVPWLAPTLASAETLHFDVDLDGGQNRGFVYCYHQLYPGDPISEQHIPNYFRRSIETRLDGVSVEPRQEAGAAVTGIRPQFFEDDRYYYFRIMDFTLS
jgi:hypothetical protein